MKVLISGAGIAGLTLAMCLERAGHAPVIVEKAPRLRAGGYMIDFFGSGYDAAGRLGLLDALAEIHYPITRLVEVDPAGREFSSLDYPTLRRLLGGRHFNFMRGDLERVLHEQLAGRVPIRFGTEVQACELRPAGVAVTLSDGTTDTWDLLVGADGVHSRVRALSFGEESRYARYLGMRTAAYFLDCAPAGLGGAEAFRILTAVDRMAGLYPIRDGRLAVFLLYRTPSPLAHETAAPCDALRRAFAGLGWVLPEVLAACGADPAPYVDDVSQIEVPTWHDGRVVLLGDACQAVSLVAGQGASLAMAGAVVLAEELARGDVPAALARYQARVRPFVATRQANARRFVRWFLPDAGWRLAARNTLMRAASLPFGARLVVGTFDTASLFEGVGAPGQG